MTEAPKSISGQTLTETILINDSVEISPSVKIARSPYLLERYDFDKLANSANQFQKFAEILLGAVIGLFINLAAKYIGSKIDQRISFDLWEVYAFTIALVLMGICYIISYCTDSEHKKIKKKITQHFKDTTN